MQLPLVIKKHPRITAAIITLLVLVTLTYLALPKKLFTSPTCTVITDTNGELLAATIANDGQYRFPETDSLPTKFKECIVMFEDKHFYYHIGVNPLSIVRAAIQNIKAKRIVSGGSTITMQTIRLWRKDKSRTVKEKLIEIFYALRLECSYSKNEILNLYASHAPFGGNVVGLSAASWRYFQRQPEHLSWAESAALAVLPNAPALVFPGKNQEIFRAKRDRLLGKLLAAQRIDSLTYNLALQEPLPGEPMPLPQTATHLLTRAIADGFEGKMVRTTIDRSLQERATEIVNRHGRELAGNSINNAAVLVCEVATGRVIAYVGNTKPLGTDNGNQVDIIRAPRSTGSILKPLLYASMLNEGMLLPHTLVADIPTQIGGYTPKNYAPTYDGAVPASNALSRSLNVPSVRMLQQYGVERFHTKLKHLGLTTLSQPANHYGLSLILGGAEATLWDLTGIYASLARWVNRFNELESRYAPSDLRPPHYLQQQKITSSSPTVEHVALDAASIYFTFDAMKEVSRPDELSGWKYFISSRSIAWKTGTSYGHRDAWAVGVNPTHVVAVWAGNASGEGRPDLTGVSAAAPILFDVFGLLPPSPWFQMPIDDMQQVPVCRLSGHRASEFCDPIDTVFIPTAGLNTSACPYHTLIHLNREGTHRVTDQCVSPSQMQHVSWFVLPPAMEWFYKSKNPHYRPLPPYLDGCKPTEGRNPIAILYPRTNNAVINVPVDLDGKLGYVVLEAAHSRPDATLYWHLNDTYLGSTTRFHKLSTQPPKGKHTLTVVDDEGETVTLRFKVE